MHRQVPPVRQDSADPINFLSAAWSAGAAQLSRDDAADKQGLAGYGKRYSAAIIDNAPEIFLARSLSSCFSIRTRATTVWRKGQPRRALATL